MNKILINIGKGVLNIFIALIMLIALFYLYIYELNPIYLPMKDIQSNAI